MDQLHIGNEHPNYTHLAEARAEHVDVFDVNENRDGLEALELLREWREKHNLVEYADLESAK